ncbi:beta-lactamase/transpeptidase-like protein [Yarrowia lipolytica]|nr:beta-lactamase/transpeptidase-like protein [Yarrowia lipolytica]RDW42427.1 beta-lactamase/transpeptidase-like protein [Yarrowia lipolytica]
MMSEKHQHHLETMISIGTVGGIYGTREKRLHAYRTHMLLTAAIAIGLFCLYTLSNALSSPVISHSRDQLGVREYPKVPNSGICDPQFPAHQMDHVTIDELDSTLNLTDRLDSLLAKSSYNKGNYSISIFGRQNVLYERYSNKTNSDSIYRIASITKVFTDLATLILRQNLSLSLDDDVRRYIPLNLSEEFSNERVSLRSLGSHTSGFPGTIANIFSDIYWDDKEGVLQTPIDNSTCDSFTTMCRMEDILAQFENSHMTSIPNSFPEYFNEAFGLLGEVLSRVDPKERSYDDIVIQEILEPLRMNSSFFDLPHDLEQRGVYDPVGMFNLDIQSMRAAGGLYSTATDMTRFIQGTMLGTAHLLSKFELAEWFQPVVALPNGDEIGFPWETVSVSLGRRTTKVYTKGGSLGHLSLSFAIPEVGLGGIIMTSEIPDYAKIAAEIANEVTQVGIKYLAGLSEKYTGTYEGYNSHGNKIVISIEVNAQSLYVTRAYIGGYDLLKEQNTSSVGLQPTGHDDRFLISKTTKGCLAWEARERATSNYQGLDVLVWNDGEWLLPAFNTTLKKTNPVVNSAWVDLGKKIVLPNPITGLFDE